MNMKISIIVPVYNVEDFLDKCVNSLVNQTYTNLEIILVDDGSPDRCGDMCNQWAKKDARIKVVHKENGGLSDARNAGLDAASGECIMFIDSDDYVHHEMIERMHKNITETSANMVVCDLQPVDENGNYLRKNNVDLIDNIVTSIEYWVAYYDFNYTYAYIVSCGKLYRSKLFHSLRFNKGKINEDEFIIHKIVDQCKKISTMSDVLYFYVQRTGSIMQSKYTINRLDVCEAFVLRSEYFQRNKLHKYSQENIQKSMKLLSSAAINLEKSDLKTERYQNLLNMTKVQLKALMCEYGSFKFKILGWSFQLSENLYRFEMRVLSKLKRIFCKSIK